jgi:pimeloyl-ACP methyl ester carboxylesterase
MPVVILPGNGCSVADFQPVMELGSARYRMVGVDIPGREPTEWPDEPFDFLADLPPVIDWVLSVLGVGSHFIVGHSMGGMAALQHANRHRGRVLGLSLLEGFVTLQIHQQTVARNGFRLIRAQPHEQMLFERRRRENARWLNDHQDFRDGFWRTQQLHDARPWVADLGVPIQVIIGDLGQLLPQVTDLPSWQIQLGMEGVDNLEVALVPSAGHWMMLDDPRLTTKLLTGFFDQVRAYG